MPKDPMDIAFEKSGGIAAFVKWIKASNHNRGDFYSWWAKRFSSPLVQNNVNVTVDRSEGDARRRLETAMMRIIDARKNSVGDPACYVDGELVTDAPRLAIAASTPQTPDAGVAQSCTDGVSGSLGSNSENVKSPKQGTLFSREPVATAATGGQNKKNMSSRMPTVPGLYAGAANESLDDNLSATQKFYLYHGRSRMP